MLDAGVEIAAWSICARACRTPTWRRPCARAGSRSSPATRSRKRSPARPRKASPAPSLAPVDRRRQARRRWTHLACDLILMAVGYSPAAHLLHHAGTKFDYDDRQPHVPARQAAGACVRGRLGQPGLCAGSGDSRWQARRLAGGARRRSRPGRSRRRRRTWARTASRIPGRSSRTTRAWTSSISTRTCKYKDLINGIADGFDNVELLKRYSTVGMGPSQGKHSRGRRGAHRARARPARASAA